MLTANKQKRHQWQIFEPQQKHKHKIQLCIYVRAVFVKLTWGNTLSQLAIWSIILS